MNRRLKFYLIGLAIGLPLYLLFFKKKPVETTPVVVEKQFPTELKAQFECKNISTDEDAPLTIVQFSANGKSWHIDSVSQSKVFEKAEFAQHQIPETALAACGGWWAGAGDYFYAIREGDSLKIYQGWQAEEQTDEGFHYEVVRALGAGDF